MKNKDNHIDNQILLSILEQTASENEKKLFEEWMITDPANQKTFEKMQKIWSSSEELEVFAKIDVDADWKIVRAKANNSFKTQRIALFMRYAASVLLVVSLGLVYLYQTVPGFGKLTQEKTTSENKEVLLADGTKVILNKNSKLVYPNYFNSKSRNVKLEGEAYFEVKPNPNKAFVIASGNALIKVLGTSFTVRNESDTKVSVMVTSGKVSFQKQNSKELLYLTKGEKGVLDGSTLTESKNNDLNFDSWKTGILRFKNTPVKQVFQDIERHYKVKITNHAKISDTLTFSSLFVNDTIETVVNELEIILRVQIKRKENQLIISDKRNH